MFTNAIQEWVRSQARRLVKQLRLVEIAPNQLTIFGLIINVFGAFLVAVGHLFAGGIVIVFAALFDILDGAVATVTGKIFRYGAFLDSTTDRYGEGVTYLALLYYFLFNGHTRVEPLLITLALIGSLLVSYVRARAQALGFICDSGILARPERVVLIVIGLIFSQILLPILWILAILTNLTALQRVWSVWRQSRHTA